MLIFFLDLIKQEGYAIYIGRNIYREETKADMLSSAVLPKGQKITIKILCSLDPSRHVGGEEMTLLQQRRLCGLVSLSHSLCAHLS